MKSLVESFYQWYRQTLRHAKYRWLIIAGTLIYLISPIDIAPDFIPIIGWIDDAIIATMLATELSQLLVEGIGRRKGIKVEDAEGEDVVEVVAEPTMN
ncbi:DUF1232 domain-containing protein [Lusitaniella coriacea LEGE 07157]|uniref:DUF1232 domain-containing protein n=1 Tax=Lusitaniella coriacea LEGE 07157 TaxID=945747 RepID=A0A8J7E1S5_9CYAN|nr:YkvA family protein [Lusitaniella coriacea]MBE9118728.1 DUF1232 domain-containing protein [Lusitaniella coriacea LEGE 07157]